jgi:hypothetical protein
MSKPLQTIDPAALAQVSGGKAREASSSSGDSDALMTALTGILGELSSLAKQNQSSGISTQDMMIMMMMMGQRSAPQVATPHQPSNWTWDANGGYWIVK